MSGRTAGARIGAIRPGGRFARALVVFLTLACMVGLGALTLWTGGRSLHAAERERVAQRSRLVASLVRSHSYIYDAARVEEVVVKTPFVRGQDLVNGLLVQQFTVTPEGDPTAAAAIVGLDGRVQVAVPSDAKVPIASLGAAWKAAVHGHSAQAPMFRYHGSVSRSTVVPIGGRSPWAVLVEIAPSQTSLGQSFDQNLGPLGPAKGGMSELDRNGIAMTSWDPRLIGTRVLSASRVAQLQSGAVLTWTEPSATGEVMSIAAANRTSGQIDIFQQRTATFFGDLRNEQHHRYVTVMLLVAGSLAVLLAFFLWRHRVASRSKAHIGALLKQSGDLVLVASRDRILSIVSPAIEDLLGHDPAAWRGRLLDELVSPDDVGRLDTLFAKAGAPGAVALNVRLLDARGMTRWFDIRASDLCDNAAVRGVVLTCHGTDERKALEDELDYQARHDALTGLANRAVFIQRLEAASLERSTNGTPFAVLFIDLDRFKPVNDDFGHGAGDHVLQTIARRLNETVRDGDLVSRFGGDEFALLLADADVPTSRGVAQRVLEAVQASIAWEPAPLRLDASIGVALSSLAHTQPEELIRAADTAMYISKQRGGGDVVVAGDESAPDTAAALPVALRPATERDVDATPRDGVPPSTAPEPPSPRTSSRTRPEPSKARAFATGRRHRIMPIVVAGALVLALALVGFAQEQTTWHNAEKARLAERKALTERVTAWSSAFDNAHRLSALAAKAPWSLTNAGLDELILQSFAASAAGGKNSVVTFSALDGKVVAALPHGARAPFTPHDAAWRDALRSRGALVPLVDHEGTLRRSFVVPVFQSGRPMGMLIVAPAVLDSLPQRLTEIVGSLGFGGGGVIALNTDGRVAVAWDRTLVGKRIVDPGRLAAVGTTAVEIPSTPGHVTLVSRETEPDRLGSEYIAFQQPTSDFYGDLLRGQLLPDVFLLGIIALTIVGLAVLNQRRVSMLDLSRARQHALLQHSHDILIVADDRDRATFVSASIEELLGIPVDDCGDDILHRIVDADDAERVQRVIDAARARQSATARDVRLVTADEHQRWFDVSAAAVDTPGRAGSVVVSCHETSEHKLLHDQLAFAGQHDPLTGASNRAGFTHLLETIAERGHLDFGVLFIDLDRFKAVNDSYGHAVGDEVLRVIAGRLSETIRGGDSFYRLGGDEFAVLLIGIDRERANDVAERILRQINEPIHVGDIDIAINIGATIGIAMSGPLTPHPEAVVREADVTMYRAKQAGRGRWAMANPG